MQIVNIQRLAILLLPAVTMTTTQVNAQTIDIIELYNEKDGLIKTLSVDEYDNLEDLLTAIANEIEDNDNNNDDSSNSNNDDGSSSSSSSNSNDFNNIMQAANEAYNEEMANFNAEQQEQQIVSTSSVTEECNEDEVLTHDSKCAPIDDIPKSPAANAEIAVAVNEDSSTASATSIPFPSGPPTPNEPPQEDGSNEQDNNSEGNEGDATSEQ